MRKKKEKRPREEGWKEGNRIKVEEKKKRRMKE